MTKLFLIDPFNQKNLFKDELRNSPFVHLYTELEKLGVSLKTYDRGELKQADKIIFFNHNKKLLSQCESLNIGKERRVLVLWEPETVLPDQYKKCVWENYGDIICFREDLEKQYNFKKVNWPQGQTIKQDVLKFCDRKMVTLINANKFSYVAGELYSLRRVVIKYFEKKNDLQFDLYGRDWGINPFLNLRIMAYYGLMALKCNNLFSFITDFLSSLVTSWSSYRGEIVDKYKVLEEYKFNICFENEATYVTEKIFDSLSVGTIPIYKGPEEIKKLVPRDCYVDYDQFNSMDEMYNFIYLMTETEFQQRQKKIIEYMQGPQFEQLQPHSVFRKLAEVVVR